MQLDPAAKRYAHAAIDIAVEHGTLDEWERDMRSLGAVVAMDEAATFLGNRQVTGKAKEDFLQQAAGDVSPLVWNLVRLLDSKNRLGLLGQIASEFQDLADERRGVAHAHVVTAVALDQSEQEALAQRLSELSGKRVDVKLYQDEEILGGLVARIGDQLIDGSTKSKLIALKRRLAGISR